MRNFISAITASFILLCGVGPLQAKNNISPKPEGNNEKMQSSRVLSFVISEDTLRIRPKWFIPDYLKLQYAGLLGFVSVGAGYNFTPRYDGTLYFGVLSETFGGSSVNVQTLSYKSSWGLFRPGLLGPITPKAGASLNWGYTNNTFRRLPEHYPEKYYFQNRLHIAPFYGAEWKREFAAESSISAIGLYAEMSTLDAYLLEFFRTKYVTIDKIWNLALGITIYFN